MDFSVPKYDQLRSYIKIQHNIQKDWSAIKKLDYFGMNRDIALSFISSSFLNGEELHFEMWINLVEFVEQRDKERIIVKLGKNIKSNASIPQDTYSAWQLYKNKLISQKWSENSSVLIPILGNQEHFWGLNTVALLLENDFS